MNRKEKRSFISQALGTSHTRMTEDETNLLFDFLTNYDDKYRGQSTSKTHTSQGRYSEGKFTRTETNTYTFEDTPGIRYDYSYHDDDGQTGSSTQFINTARGILNWLKNHH